MQLLDTRMSITDRKCLLAVLFTFFLATAAHARITDLRPAGPLATRAQNPLYLQLLALPMESPQTLNRDQFETTLSTTFSNLFEFDQSGNTQTNLDMELWRTALTLGYGISDELDVKIEIPFISNSGGFLDGFVQWYHSALGVPNAGRDTVANGLFTYQVAQGGVTLINYTAAPFGLSDITLRCKYLLSDKISLPFKLAVAPYVKLPTGLKGKGLGSGHVDAGLSVLAQKSLKRFHLTTQFGAIVLGNVNNLGAITQRYFLTFGQGLELQIVDGLSALVQLTGNTTAFKNVDTTDLSYPVVDLNVGFAGNVVNKGKKYGPIDEFFYQASFGEDIIASGPSVDFSVLLLTGIRY